MTPSRITRRAPLIGEHNQEIFCGELGLTSDDLTFLSETDVLLKYEAMVVEIAVTYAVDSIGMFFGGPNRLAYSGCSINSINNPFVDLGCRKT